MNTSGDLFAPATADVCTDDAPHELAPRQYAADLMRLPRVERARALDAVPEHLRGWVAHYVIDWHLRRKARRNRGTNA